MRVMRGAMILGALALGACAAGSMGQPGEPGQPGGTAGQCDAQASRSLIGSHRGAVDFAPGANVRFVCTTCPMTRDYRPDRLTILFNEQTGIIEDVRCV